MRTAATVAIFMSIATGSACADEANGERLANRWCASCHDAQASAAGSAPALATIARKPGFSREKLATSLIIFHPKMPDMLLTRGEASDLADYICGLGSAK